MSKVIVVGGGASGIIAAIMASKNNDVTIVDTNDKLGKKILLTGNGKCNYWNDNINLDNYYSDNMDILNTIISSNNQEEVLKLLNNLGIYPKIRNGYYYPYSSQASSVRNLLLLELEKNNIEIIDNFKVDNIVKENGSFLVFSGDKKLIGDKVILATGSKACPKTGSDGTGYLLAQKLGHNINKVTPALVQLIGNDNYFKDWDGVRCDSKVTLYVDGNQILSDIGEIQLTNYGISGIVTFNISGYAAYGITYNKKVNVEINFMPWIDDLYSFLTERDSQLINYTLEELLESVIPYKLMHVIFKRVNIDKNSKWNQLSEFEKQGLVTYIQKFPFEVVGTNDYDRAQVCRGGVSLSDINPDTMESTITSGLYLTGELLDVDGRCGGFNLGFAFITGYLAGRSIK